MNQAIFEFYDLQNTVVDNIAVDLLDTPGSKAWQYAAMINNSTKKILTKKISSGQVHNAYLDQQYQQLKDLIGELNNTEYSFAETVPLSPNDIDQYFLNRLHRHFTTTCKTIWNPNFRNINLTEHLNSILQDINCTIHRIEIFYTTLQKLKWDQQSSEIWIVPEDRSLSFDISPYIKCHTFQHADLILDPHILGKTLLESYLCNDNPLADDTNGHVITNGGACFVMDDSRQTIYNSDDFNNWLENHGCSKHTVFADFPIGNFATGMKERLLALVSLHQFKDYKCRIILTN